MQSHFSNDADATERILAPPKPRLAYSLAEAAQATGLSYRCLMNYVNARKLRATRQGRRILILARDLERFIQRDHPSVKWQPNGRGRSRKVNGNHAA